MNPASPPATAGGPRLPLRWKLALAIAASALLMTGAIAALAYVRGSRAALASTERLLTERAARFATALDADLRAVAQVPRSAAAFLTDNPDLSVNAVDALLHANVRQNPLISGSAAAYLPGLAPADAPARQGRYAPYVFLPPHLAADPAQRPHTLARINIADVYDYTQPQWEWFHAVAQDLAERWTEPYFDDGAGDILMVTFSAPFFRDGKLRGVVTADIPLAALRARLPLHEFSGDTGFALMSRSGVLLAGADDDADAVGRVNLLEWARSLDRPDLHHVLQRMRDGQTDAAVIPAWTGIDDRQMLAFAPVPSAGWSFGAGEPLAVIMAPAYRDLAERVLAGLAIIAVATAAVLALTFRITAPLRRLSDGVARLAAGDLDAHVPESRARDEVGDLSRAFNAMTARLRRNIDELTRESAAREAAESELRFGRQIQAALLPRTFPPFPDRPEFDLWAINAPARQVAGDFFDYFFTAPDTLFLLIADVSGKGAPAAMFMAVARTVIRNLAQTGSPPADLLTRANAALVGDNIEGMFVTVWAALYNVRTGELTYANAGHPLPFLVPDGEQHAQPFGDVTGPILGIIPDAEYEQRSASLPAGAALVLYTDGVPEARVEVHARHHAAPAQGAAAPSRFEFYGEQRYRELLDHAADASAEKLCDLSVDAVDRFQGGPTSRADDVTVLALRRLR